MAEKVRRHERERGQRMRELEAGNSALKKLLTESMLNAEAWRSALTRKH